MALTEKNYVGLLAARTGLVAFIQRSEREARVAGATHAQHHVLLALRGHDETTAATVKDIAAALGITSPARSNSSPAWSPPDSYAAKTTPATPAAPASPSPPSATGSYAPSAKPTSPVPGTPPGQHRTPHRLRRSPGVRPTVGS